MRARTAMKAPNSYTDWDRLAAEGLTSILPARQRRLSDWAEKSTQPKRSFYDIVWLRVFSSSETVRLWFGS